MANNFEKITVLSYGTYYIIDRKSEFHQTACKHEFIKGQIVKTLGELTATMVAAQEDPIKKAIKLAGIVGKVPIGRLPKKINICKKCGKVKARNN